jgi:hypothetical protein
VKKEWPSAADFAPENRTRRCEPARGRARVEQILAAEICGETTMRKKASAVQAKADCLSLRERGKFPHARNFPYAPQGICKNSLPTFSFLGCKTMARDFSKNIYGKLVRSRDKSWKKK